MEFLFRTGWIMINGYKEVVDWLASEVQFGDVIYSVGELMFGAGLTVLMTWIVVSFIVPA